MTTPAMSTDDLSRYADYIVKLARKAGEISLKYFQKSFEVEIKGDLSPVTVADRETEAFLRADIERTWPGHGIIGEEYGNKEARPGEPTWTLDPIDGTKSFVAGIPLYTMIISLVVEGEPLLGMLYQPVLNEMVWGARGLGAWYNGAPARVSGTESLDRSKILYTDASHLHNLHPDFARRIHERCMWSRSWGDGYGYILVATGRADAMIDPAMHIWDIMPTKPVIEAAGGRFTTLRGEDRVGDDALASNGLLHGAILDCHRA